MKTIKEIAKEKGVMFEGGKYSVVSIDEMEEIAKAYASQAIDEAAKAATANIQESYSIRNYGKHAVVDRASIWKVKELLK